MKRNLALAILLLVLQQAIYYGVLWLSVNLIRGCSFTSQSFGAWQCSTNSNPSNAPLAAMIVLPPLIAKFIFHKLGQTISWKRVIITQAIVASLVILFFLYLDIHSCSCGGA